MEFSPPNVTFRRDLFGPRLASWNALIELLAMIQLSQGTDEFRWNLNENGKFSVDFLYRGLKLAVVPVDTNKKI